MPKKFTEPHTVWYYECDTTGQLSIPMLLSIVIKTSESQSEKVGRGSDYVATFGLTWVIIQYEMHINRMPKVNEQILVTTQAASYNKFFCYRNFWVHDLQGNELVLIQSTFVLMDLKNRKMSRVLPEIVAPFGCEKRTKIQRSKKFEEMTQPKMQPYRVRYLDIDSNSHVNNAKYLDWMLDVLGYDFLVTHDAKTIIVKFDKEVEYGNQIQSYWEEKAGEGTLTTIHQIKNGTTLCTEAMIDWDSASR